MRVVFGVSILVLFFISPSYSQQPVTILNARWERTTIRAADPQVTPVGPVTPITTETKYFQRKAREQRTDNPMDPHEHSIEGRSAAMDKAVRESRTPKPDDVTGYVYAADVRNDTGSTIAIIFWEYRFTEVARPTNVVRRQFLCGVKLKNGEKRELRAFSTFGPSDVIGVESLAKDGKQSFTEEALINRIELADGSIIQRNGWKFSDVADAVHRATSTPWGTGTCRPL